MRRFLPLLRPVPVVALAAWLAHPPPLASPAARGQRSQAAASELAMRHLDVDPSDVHWLDAAPGLLDARWKRSRAVVRAHERGASADVYVVRARLAPGGALLGVDGVFDLTRTSAASEELLVSRGEHAAWVIGGSGRIYRVEMADFRGEREPQSEQWTSLARLQQRVTRWQHTGQWPGVGRRSFKLDPAAHRVALSAETDGLVVLADEHRIVIPYDPGRPIQGERFVREEDRELARPGSLVTWAVDRARDLSWFGDERMQLTKAIAYRALDAVDRMLGRVNAPSAAEHAEELGELGGRGASSSTDPSTGWPPPAIPAPTAPALDGEGRWILLDHDPFVATNPGAPAALASTYVRGDGARADSRVFVVAWDPRQVELGMVPGTEEPQSATGETGTGMIPRRPELMSRLLGAFNGGFQSTHGDFGMRVDGNVVVPPRPYAATVARLPGGVTGFGTWPLDLTIPEELQSFRQNLTPLVADGKLNPYGREWWGGVPHDWEDETRTVRSGLCLTRDGFILYFYGTKIDHVHLGRTMLAARCDYGLHLDMNQGHTGLELYRVYRDGALPPLSGKLDGHWQTQGDVTGMPGWKFRGRRLVRNLQLMHFPRYIRRGQRDYFYLTLRPILPGAPLVGASGDAGEGAWTVDGLPQHGFPAALSTTSLRPDPARPETKVRVLRIDPSVLRPARADDPSGATVLTIDAAPAATPGQASLWLTRGRASIAGESPDPASLRVTGGGATPAGAVSAAVGVDDDGVMLYAEVATAADPAHDGALLEKLFEGARCPARIFLPAPLRVGLGGVLDLADHPVAIGSTALRLVREDAPRARRIFSETPILAPGEWMPVQRQIRWFPKEVESATPPEAASARPPE